MVDKYSDLRLFLLSVGLTQTAYYTYGAEIPSDKYRTFNVSFDLVSGKLHIIYPEIEYNKQNPYSPKKNNVTVELNTDDLESCKHMIIKTLNRFM